MKRILGLMRKAIQKYNMIQPGDRIAVAVSGGKDSMVLLDAMNRLKCFYPLEFEIGAIYIDIGFESNAELPLRNYCDKNNIEFCVSKSSIKTIAFDIEKAKSPCSLCSRMRRAALCCAAKELGYNKIALGHNMDDAVETFMMNLMYNGKNECFEPIMLYDDINISIIRPMISVPEKEIKSYAVKQNLPVVSKVCPIDGKTDREKIKNIIKDLEKENRYAKKNIYTAITKLEAFISKEVATK